MSLAPGRVAVAATALERASRLIARCRALAEVTDVPGETTRLFLSPATREVQRLLAGWMREAALTVSIDAIGNLHALDARAQAGLPRILIGSHIDTVINAGAFDGLLGVLAGVELAQLAAGAGLAFGLEIIAFSEEEGVRFQRPFLGSSAMIGENVPITVTDRNGVTLQQAIEAFGHRPNCEVALSPLAFAYLELHIEQGPVLEAEGRALAAVSAIAGQTRLRLRFAGQANHAGTTPMTMRQDAMLAAAEWILATEQEAAARPGMVATVGSVEVSPGLVNVIPGEVSASLDLRHADDRTRQEAVAVLRASAERIALRRGMRCSIDTLLDQPAQPMAQSLTALLASAALDQGYDASPIPSGAGHDAMILARRLPAAMLFLRTPGGLSHHPGEQVFEADVEAALRTSFAFLRMLEPPGGSNA